MVRSNEILRADEMLRWGDAASGRYARADEMPGSDEILRPGA